MKDWQAVKEAYEFSGEPLRAIGETHGVSHTAIRKRAAAEGWQRQRAEIVAVASRKPMETDETRGPITSPVNLLRCPRCKGPGSEIWFSFSDKRVICRPCGVHFLADSDPHFRRIGAGDQHLRNLRALEKMEEVVGIPSYLCRPRERQLGPDPKPKAYEL